MINVLIVHYNTPKVTECVIKSLNKHTKDAKIYLFDNSNRQPFTAKFDNVTVIDNTKGQIINFDKWLENYPNRNKSLGRITSFASAKHCKTVDVFMDMFDDNFILLDSDVLLKTDISFMYDDNNMFVGEIADFTWGKSFNKITKRLLPFLCFINNKKAKELGIRFFEEHHMAGLYNPDLDADYWDTGGYYYLMTKDMAHKEIKLDDISVHFKGASYQKINRKEHLTVDQWLAKYKALWDNVLGQQTVQPNSNKKKVVYTCITGTYDSVTEPSFANADWDYVCFTDNPYLTSKRWKIVSIPDELRNLQPIKLQRYYKMNPHLVLPEYELSLYIDANVLVRGNLNLCLSEKLDKQHHIFISQHPTRNCIYKEATACIRAKKDNEANINAQISKFRAEGFPENYGLVQANIIFRYHNEPDCIEFMNAWWDIFKNNACNRDQLSFNYVAWKHQNVHFKYLQKDLYRSSYFLWNGKHKKFVKPVTPQIPLNTPQPISKVEEGPTLKPIPKVEEGTTLKPIPNPTLGVPLRNASPKMNTTPKRPLIPYSPARRAITKIRKFIYS